jgi:UDP-2,3-diacylglucosamine hydrolase
LLMRSLEEVAPGGASTLHPSDNDPSPGTPTLRRHLTVVKVAKPNQDMRFDVPVIGIGTLDVMIRAGASCLSVEAGRTLLFDRETLLRRAGEENIAIIAVPRTY